MNDATKEAMMSTRWDGIYYVTNDGKRRWLGVCLSDEATGTVWEDGANISPATGEDIVFAAMRACSMRRTDKRDLMKLAFIVAAMPWWDNVEVSYWLDDARKILGRPLCDRPPLVIPDEDEPPPVEGPGTGYDASDLIGALLRKMG
jgi:hypothetical protein